MKGKQSDQTLRTCRKRERLNLDLEKERKKWVPKIPLCTNIRSNAEMGIEPCFLNSLYESYQIISPFEIVLKTITKNREQSPIFREKLAEEKSEQKSIMGCSGNKDGENVKYIARSRLMDVPENVGLNHIQASIFCLLYQILPHLHAAHSPRKLQTKPKHISTKTHKNRKM
jgi:hypothetical protein